MSANNPAPEGVWMICETCGAGPFLEKGERFLHWYDYAHLTYRIVDPPEDGVERPYDAPAAWWTAALEARAAQHAFDMAEPS